MKRLSLVSLTLVGLFFVAGCPGAPETKDRGLDPSPPPADVPQDDDSGTPKADESAPTAPGSADSQPTTEGGEELPPLPKSTPKEDGDVQAPELSPPEQAKAAPEEQSAPAPEGKEAPAPDEKSADAPGEKPADAPKE